MQILHAACKCTIVTQLQQHSVLIDSVVTATDEVSFCLGHYASISFHSIKVQLQKWCLVAAHALPHILNGNTALLSKKKFA